MSAWEQVSGTTENDPIKLAETGEKQQWAFHGHVFEFECRTAPHKHQLIPNGVELQMSIVETGVGPEKAISCNEVAIQAGDGAELLSDFDAFARINAEAKVREIFAYAGKMVLAHEELAGPAEAEGPGDPGTD